MKARLAFGCLALLFPLVSASAGTAPAASLATWPEPTRENKPWTRWWWLGSAVDEANLTRELESFAAAGFGGVEITPIYGVRGAESRYVDFLSPRWVQLVEHTGREAKRLGLGVDMATGTGWPFGGPWIQPADAIQKATLVDGKLAGAPTGMKVKRAAPGDEGLVVDPYSPAALGHYLAPFSAAFEKFPRKLLRSQFHDSFEYYEASWTPELPRVFRDMHGYDVQEFAAALTAKESDAQAVPADTLARVKADYRATLAKLHLDYVRTWRDWSHARGWLIRNQAHGAPANLLDLYANADIPEVEVFGSTPFAVPGLRRLEAEVRSTHSLPESLILRMASSAAHVAGHPLTSCETLTWLREHWKEAPSMMKPEIDRIFAEGINHLVYHGAAYSPADAPRPGWLFYASTEFNDRNPLWSDFAALNAYVTRVQSILQAGAPDNDVLVYWPAHDVWDNPKGLMKMLEVADTSWMVDSPAGKLGRALLARGYAFDWISDDQLAATSTAGRNSHRLRTPGGNTYSVLVVPATRRMPVETLRQIVALAAAGAHVVIQQIPDDVPGYGRLDERRAAFRELLAALAKTSATVVGRDEADAVLGTPAFAQNARREAIVDRGVSFTRRRRDDGTDYFFTNLGAKPLDGWVTLGVDAADAFILDPLTGRTGRAALKADGPRAAIYLQLAGGESLIVRTSQQRQPDAPTWTYLAPADEPRSLAGEWQIDFTRGGPALPAPIRTTELKSWTELGDAEAQRFAGTATYRLEFELPADVQADDWELDLGDVRETARVRLNGADAGLAWSLPFRLRVGQFLQPGRNILEIDVTNLAANRIRDLDRRGVPWKIMREINYVDIRYQPFDASKWELTPSGMLGPVRLVPLTPIIPR
ncbi:MAG: glycoside hydrolase [Opitutae bacterium]|nr:glycoside hydrolase [Opitutae bacterium]